jgi:hypothetical protein
MKKPFLKVWQATVLLFVACFVGSTFFLARAQTYSTSGSSGTPTLASCGLAPVVNGTDTLGSITLGTGLVTSCTLQFSAALSSAPICVITTNSLMVQAAITSLDNTQFTVGLSGSLPGGSLYYFCPLR